MAVELAPHDKQTLEVIRRRVDEYWLDSRTKSEHYREDVGFLIDRIDELTGAALVSPPQSEEAKA